MSNPYEEYDRWHLEMERQELEEWQKKLLTDPDPKERRRIATNLGYRGDYETLSRALANERDSTVREYIAMALGRTKNINAFTALRSLLNDPSVWVRGHTINAMEELETSILLSDRALSRNLRLQIIDTLSRLDQSEPNPDIRKLAETLRLYYLSITK
jgi:HEAT repeat protein